MQWPWTEVNGCNSLWLWRRLPYRNVSHCPKQFFPGQRSPGRLRAKTFHSFTIFCVVTDIDECTTNAHDCHLDATCSNTDGSFTCSCNQGYSGDGKQCDGMFVISASKKPKDSMLTGESGEGGSWGCGCQANKGVSSIFTKQLSAIVSVLLIGNAYCILAPRPIN